jgi:hypothetical protein
MIKEVLRDRGDAAVCGRVQGANRQVDGANTTEDSVDAIMKHRRGFMLTPRYHRRHQTLRRPKHRLWTAQRYKDLRRSSRYPCTQHLRENVDTINVTLTRERLPENDPEPYGTA